MIRKIIVSALTLAFVSPTTTAETIAAVGKVWTGTDAGVIQNGIVIIEDGEIVSVGGSETNIPTGATIIGRPGAWITPGVIAPFSRVGLVEVGAESTTNDTGGATDRYAASLRAVDGYNPAATSISVTRIEGVTHVAVAPSASSSIIAGLGFIADTSGTPASIVDDASFLYIEIGEGGAQRAGGSRAASWAYLRGALAEGEKKRIGSYRVGETNLVSEDDARVLSDVVRGRIKLMLHAHRASDLLKVMALKDTYRHLDMVIVGAAEGWVVADALANAEIPVIIDPFANLPASFESLAATSHNAERLIAAGVTTAFAHLGDDGHQARLVLQSAGNAVANGVEHDDALHAITTAPADIFDLSDSGTIERGANGDIVVWDGDPLEITSRPSSVVIKGNIQSMESRQTKLRDRYLSLEPNNKPFSYRLPD